MTKINVEKEYYHIKTKIIYEILCIDNDVIYIRKIGKTNYKVQSLNRKHPIIQITLTDFKKNFNIY